MTPPDILDRLAREVVNAQAVCALHRGQLDHAMTAVAHSGRCSGGWRWMVEGKTITYTAAGAEGNVRTRDVVERAGQLLTREAGQRVVDAYARYVRAATVPYTLAHTDPAYQADPDGMWAKANAARDASRALDQATRAALAAEPAGRPGVQYALFDLGGAA